MIRNPSPMLLALLLCVSVAAVEARQAAATETEDPGAFAAMAQNLKREAERAFAEERWSEAVVACVRAGASRQRGRGVLPGRPTWDFPL